jgi:hypothetical protein
VDRALAPLAALVLALAPGAGAARADVFTLKDGSVVEGEVLREFRDEGDRPDRWEVRTLRGIRTVASGEVRARRDGGGPWPWREFEDKYAFIDPRDPAENAALGAWARERGLESEAVRAFRRALEADPEHLRARTALGYQKVDGRWVVPAGRERVPEDRGEALPGEAAGALDAVLGRVLARRRSENFRIESTWMDQAGLGRTLDTLERAREATLAFLGEPPPPGARGSTYFLLRDAAEYGKAVDALVAPAHAARADREEARRELALFRAGHLAILPGGSPGCVAWKVDEGETADRAFLAHFAVHETWRAGLSQGVRDPDWIREAVAYAILNDRFPDDPTWCVAAGGYGRSDRVPSAWRNTRTWAAAARTLAVSGKALAFRDLAVQDVNSLSFDSLVQAWSTLRVLRAKDEAGTRAFLARVRRGTDQFKALADGLRLDPDGVDRLWRAEVLKAR